MHLHALLAVLVLLLLDSGLPSRCARVLYTSVAARIELYVSMRDPGTFRSNRSSLLLHTSYIPIIMLFTANDADTCNWVLEDLNVLKAMTNAVRAAVHAVDAR